MSIIVIKIKYHLKFCQLFPLQFTEHGIEGVVPLELLPADVRSKYQAKPGDKSKRAKKEETKGSLQQVEESQVSEIFFPSLTVSVQYMFVKEDCKNHKLEVRSHNFLHGVILASILARIETLVYRVVFVVYVLVSMVVSVLLSKHVLSFLP